jgi:hypothetical protein
MPQPGIYLKLFRCGQNRREKDFFRQNDGIIRIKHKLTDAIANQMAVRRPVLIRNFVNSVSFSLKNPGLAAGTSGKMIAVQNKLKKVLRLVVTLIVYALLVVRKAAGQHVCRPITESQQGQD